MCNKCADQKQALQGSPGKGVFHYGSQREQKGCDLQCKVLCDSINVCIWVITTKINIQNISITPI